MASEYVYQRQLPAAYVRLLTVVSDGENFRGSLQEFRKDNLPYFNALSWCWSSEEEIQSTSFECDEQLFPVSRHLYNLLSNVNPRNTHSSIRIWVDSICINQDDLEEKSAHVAYMHEIYGRARNVIIWLGMPDGGSDLVMDSRKTSKLNTALQLVPSSSIAQSVTAPGVPHADDPIWKAVGRLCDRDWFYRTWVIQEIALARNVELLCGTQRLDWDDFVNLVSGISRAGLTSICRGPRSTGTTRPDGFGALMDLAWIRKMLQKDDMSMSYLLHMVRFREVTKPVDNVYGLLGILGQDVRSAIKVNYAENEQQYWEAYVDMAEQIITADDRAFWLLCMASSRERPEQLPTWCPNFNSLSPEYLDFGNQNWRAGLGGKPTKEGGIRLIKASSSIQAPGFLIDVVDEVIHIGGPYSTAVGQEDRGRSGNTETFLWRDSQCLELTLSCFDDENNARDAYARTLIVNSWINGSPIQLSQTERVRNAYEDSKAYLSKSGTSTVAAAHTSADDERQQLAQQYITQLGWWQERPFYTTENGRIGRGAFDMRAGDAICVFYQAGPAFILRYEQGSNIWKLVGDAYLHGCMDLDRMPGEGRGADMKFTIH
jgi:hypothetical protein